MRAGGPGDLEEVAAIQAASPQASQWPPADYLHYEFRVAVDNGRVSGFLVGRRLMPGETEILNLAVQPGQRRKGVARTLLRAWIGEFPGTCHLEVRESNRAALELYKSLGFQELTRRDRYYESPPEGAIVLKFHSC